MNLVFWLLKLKSTREIAHKMPRSYSQGIADLNFINDYCHQNLIDYEVRVQYVLAYHRYYIGIFNFDP